MNKTLLLISSLLTLVIYPLKAQENKASIISGINVSQIHGDDLGGYNKLGLAFGVSVHRQFSDNLLFKPEILYIQKGSSTSSNDSYNYSIKLNYLDIPILLGYRINDLFIIEGGPAFGVLISSKQGSGNFFSTFENVNKLNFETLLGIEYRALENLSIKMRYGVSAISIGKVGNLRNDSISFLLQYFLN